MPIGPPIPKRDPISLHARELVGYIHERIQLDFGISLLMSYEKEGYAKTRNHIYPDVLEDDAAMMRGDAVRKIIAARKTEDKEAGTLHPMRRFYKEGPSDQYEMTTSPAPPKQAVVRADTQTANLESFMPEVYEHLPNLTEQERKQRKEFTDKFDLHDLRFDATRHYPQNPNIARDSYSGLHLNVSLWEKRNGEDINLCHDMVNFYKAERKENLKIMQQRIWHELRSMVESDILLLAPSEGALKRARDKFSKSDDFWRHKDQSDADWDQAKLEQDSAEYSWNHRMKHSRFEFSVPSTDTRNDMAALFLVTAMYEGLKNWKQRMKDGPPTKNIPATPQGGVVVAGDYAQGVSQWEKGGTLFERLERIVQSDETEQGTHMQPLVTELKQNVTTMLRQGKLTQPKLSDHLGLAL